MIYLFCSAAKPLYKRDALLSTCYPAGHLFRFRYDKKYVDENIWNNPRKYENKNGVIIFLDTLGEKGKQYYQYYPIRIIKTTNIFLEGSAIYIDFICGDFINYKLASEKHYISNWWKDFFDKIKDHPCPPSEKSGRGQNEPEGHFIISVEKMNPDFPTNWTVPYESWESLIRFLDNTADLKGSTFFTILGFYRVKRMWAYNKAYREIRIESTGNNIDSYYPLPMGKSVVLKLLFSRPTYTTTNDQKDRRVLKIEVPREYFVGVSKKYIYSESRYNEERIVIVCKRFFDSVISPISITQIEPKEGNDPSSVLAPTPFFLATIYISKYIIGSTVILIVLSTLCLGMNSETIKFFSTNIINNDACRKFLNDNAILMSSWSKVFAAMFAGIAAWIAFRKLPLK